MNVYVWFRNVCGIYLTCDTINKPYTIRRYYSTYKHEWEKVYGYKEQ